MEKSTVRSFLRWLFYFIKPLIPRSFQLLIRRRLVARQRVRFAGVWPVYPKSDVKPENWTGWPEKAQFALVLTHDVEKSGGQAKCRKLAKVEEELGFRSSFNFVPERYADDPELRRFLVDRGFEVGVHGLKHDGKLYESYETFTARAEKINHYLLEWQASGFRSPAMHHNLEWLHHLNVEYDCSTFDTDPFEPQPDGLGTIFPVWQENGNGNGYVELPYTLVQDFTVFVLMQEKTNRIWKEKLDWVAERGGMVLVNVHPDYICFDGQKPGPEEFPVELYSSLLEYLKTKYEGRFWNPLPRDIARFWKTQIIRRKK